jgi:hypothetical protein
MARSLALPTSPATIPSCHEPPTVYSRSPFISHPLPSAQSPFPPSSRAVSPSCPERSRGVSTAFLPRAKRRGTPTRAVSPLFVAFAPNCPLTPLSTAFTQTHPGCSRGTSHRSRLTCHVCKSNLLRSLRTLYLSCRSFSGSRPLFSIACVLFDKNTRGMGTPDAPATPSGPCGFARHNFGLEDFRLSGFRPGYPGATGYTDGTE